MPKGSWQNRFRARAFDLCYDAPGLVAALMPPRLVIPRACETCGSHGVAAGSPRGSSRVVLFDLSATATEHGPLRRRTRLLSLLLREGNSPDNFQGIQRVVPIPPALHLETQGLSRSHYDECDRRCSRHQVATPRLPHGYSAVTPMTTSRLPRGSRTGDRGSHGVARGVAVG